jgi:hypothetical protein
MMFHSAAKWVQGGLPFFLAPRIRLILNSLIARLFNTLL